MCLLYVYICVCICIHVYTYKYMNQYTMYFNSVQHMKIPFIISNL